MTQIHRFFQPPLKFKYLRHLRMEINFGNGGHRSDKNAVLQLAYLLDAAPLLVDLHLDIVCMSSTSRPSPVGIMDHPHHNLKRICITGFCGNGG